MRTLITGGAGFIGRFVAREFLARGHSVRILDCYSSQIHGDKPEQLLNEELRQFAQGGRPREDPAALAFVRGDVCNPAVLHSCLAGTEVVVHLAAETGTGQSMYELSHYERVNIGGTTRLAEALASGRFPEVKRVVLASSRAVYGEGRYDCRRCGPVYPIGRQPESMLAGAFEPKCPKCDAEVASAPTAEDAPRHPGSFYGLTKAIQEDILSMFSGQGYALANLRFQNVFGEMQSLRNPYTGIISIFANLARANRPIRIFEDGRESRDFIHVEDIARAICTCVDRSPRHGTITLNLGSGVATTVLEVAETIVRLTGSQSEIVVTGEFRVGDIRHACADIAAARQMLGFSPEISFRHGMTRFIEWALAQPLQASAYEKSLSELAERGLLLGGKAPMG